MPLSPSTGCEHLHSSIPLVLYNRRCPNLQSGDLALYGGQQGGGAEGVEIGPSEGHRGAVLHNLQGGEVA